MLEGQNKNSEFFDITWGGIITKDSIEDDFIDNGNALYNDHHFHYGYILYAVAVLGLDNPSFLKDY